MISMDKKAEIFESKLSQEDLVTLAYIVKLDRDKEVNTRVDKQVYTINQALDTSIAAALFDYTDLTIAEVEEILKRSNEYMKDSEEFLLKYGEDWIMKINEIKPKIKEECLKLLDQNINGQNDAVNALKEIFKDIPSKDLGNIFKETKEEWCKPKETENKAKLEEKEVSNAITPEKENKSVGKPIDSKKEEIKDMFEVIKKEIILKGNYGTYKIDFDGVQTGEIKFKTLENIKNYEEEQLRQFNNQMEELRAAFSYM